MWPHPFRTRQILRMKGGPKLTNPCDERNHGSSVQVVIESIIQITFRLDSPSEKTQRHQFKSIQADENRTERKWLQSILSLINSNK